MLAVAELWSLGLFESMELFIIILLVAAYGAGFTSFGCWRVCRRQRRPGWHFALLGTGVTALTVMLIVGQADIFLPNRWDDHKGGFWPFVLLPTTAAAVVALTASFAVVYYFRDKYRDLKNTA